MLISFTVENWMSFRNKAVLSMVASRREKQHQERLSVVGETGNRLSPVCAIYGANASGKSNLCRALAFVQDLVVNGTPLNGTIKVSPYRLDPESSEKPSRFEVAMLINERCYEFGFSATRTQIIEEWLNEILKNKEKVLYRRDAEEGIRCYVGNKQRMEVVAEGTRKNQLFLTNTIDQNVDEFRHIYAWFQESLTFIAPESHFVPLFDKETNDLLYQEVGQYLSGLDTGISRLEWKEYAVETLQLPPEVADALKDGAENTVVQTPTGDILHVYRESGHLTARRLNAVHTAEDGTTAAFDMDLESDGTRRLVDLLPAFLAMVGSDKTRVFVVDELDRSLHTLLTRHLLESFLSNCGATSRVQFIFTTHDVLLMDQDLLRRDEMWVTERLASGETTLTSFSAYKDIRSDKDIRRSYLQGRLGGVPRILLAGTLENHSLTP